MHQMTKLIATAIDEKMGQYKLKVLEMESMKQVHFIEMDLDRNGEQRLLDETEELRKKILED